MPDSSINLNNILREERKLKKTKVQESKLVPLESDFYAKISRQIQDIEDEKKRSEDIYSTKYAIIEDELKTARKALDDLINLRTAKIITGASLRASSKQREKTDLDAMTQEEQRFYNRLLELMTEWWEWRKGLINRARVKEKQPSPAPQEVPRVENKPKENDGSIDGGINLERKAPQEAVQQENWQKEPPSEGKKDISKEYIVVRLLKDIPTFVGVDGRNYTLAKEDVAVLSAVNAKALINRNAAIQISVKR